MLGGSGEPDDAAAAESPYAALASEVADSEKDAEPGADADEGADLAKEPVPVATFETPEAVLDRLTQYRTSTRAPNPVAPPVEEPAAATAETAREAESDAEVESEDEPLKPVGDDFLPNAKGIARRPGRGRKRHP